MEIQKGRAFKLLTKSSAPAEVAIAGVLFLGSSPFVNAVEPLVYVVGDHTRHDSNQKGFKYVHTLTPFNLIPGEAGDFFIIAYLSEFVNKQKPRAEPGDFIILCSYTA